MIKARTWFTLLLISVGTIAATASCGSDEATGGGGGGAAGGGLIGASGKAGAVGRAGSGGGTGTGTGTAPMLGAICGADADCGDGLICLTADGGKLGGASPGNGLCTASCTADTDCDALQTGAGCVNFGTTTAPEPYCLQTCTQGEPADISTKCQGRVDVACASLSDTSTFCVPLCRADADCATGQFCEPSSGLCGKTKPSGLPVGTACDPNATTDACEGFCITTSGTGVTPVTGTCVEFCSGELPCMYSNDATPKPGGLCIGALSDTFGSLDLGICRPNCACPSDCKFPGDMCRAWSSNATEQQLKTALGADGLCYPNVTDSVALDCGEGGAGGVSGVDPGVAGAPALP